MSESATEPTSEHEWLESLADEDDFSDLDDFSQEEIVDEDPATDEEGSPPPESEGDVPAPQEGDAEALEEGPADDAEVEASEDEAEPDEPEEAGDVEAEPEAEEAVQADADDPGDDRQDPDDQPELSWEPFTAKADGREIELDGAYASESGVFVPIETWRTQLQPHLANRSEWERERQRLQRELDEAKTARSDAEAEAEAFVEFYKELLEKPADEQWAHFESIAQNKGELLARAEAARSKSRADRLEAADSARQEAEDRERVQQWATERLDTAVDRVLSDVDFAELGIDRDTLQTRLASYHQATGKLFFVADEEFVRDNPGWGLQAGDPTIDWRVVLQHTNDLAEVRRAKLAAEAKVQAGKQQIDSKRRGRKKVPPSVKAGGTPVPGGEEPPEPTSREEWLESLR